MRLNKYLAKCGIGSRRKCDNYIEKGKLKIRIHETEYDLVDETIASTGDLSIVKPGKYHEFEALEDTICYEIYWVELNHGDIERETIGGNKK